MHKHSGTADTSPALQRASESARRSSIGVGVCCVATGIGRYYVLAEYRVQRTLLAFM